MNYAKIKYNDIANGEGIRTSLFVSGCRNHCKECFNKETWNFNYGKVFTKEVEEEIINSLNFEHISGLTILGGEPFEPENQEALLPFIKKVKEIYPNKTIWMYSGYTFEDISNGKVHTDYSDAILKEIDVLVDGKFEIELFNLKLNFRGSSNQRIINVKETLFKNTIILSKLNN